VISGLAAGIDTAAHTATLARGGRTVAVIGTGLARSYPPQNEALQRRIASECAVVSQFWPDAPPSRRSFPMRNAVMSGITLATVVVEASETSGARMQARLARAQGRPVFLLASLVERQQWAREYAAQPGTHVVRSPEEITTVVERLISPGSLVA
jgi:DNA processing protein